MNIMCIGHAAYDITFSLEQFIQENTKNRVNERIECGGGPAATAARLLGKWGKKVIFLGVIGQDEFGRRLKEEFNKYNVNIDYLQEKKNYNTTSSFIMANKENGSRTILTYRPEHVTMDSSIEINLKPDFILVDGQEIEVSKKMIEMFPDAISVIDAGRPTDEIIELSKMVDYVVCSKFFAEEVTNQKYKSERKETFYQELEKTFKKNIVITLEAEGCLYKYNNEIKVMPSIKVRPVDTTGAGDIFHGAFVYCLSEKMDFEEKLKFSNITAALSTLKIGGTLSIPEIEEVEEKINEFK